jgi:hypothetical protein
MSAAKELNPGPLSKQDLEILAYQIAAVLKDLADKPMFAEEAYTWAGWSRDKFFRLKNAGVFKGHCDDLGNPIYLKSEIIEGIKNHKQK